MLIDPRKATLLVVDIQEKLINAMSDPEGTRARARWLLAATAELELPTVISEQYPKGLGPTLAELKAASPAAQIVEKQHFSCVAAECLPASLMAREQVIVCGMETHVCVLQTVLGLIDRGRRVAVVADAIGSRRRANKEAGLARMARAGADVVTTEMVVFEWLGSADHPRFREVVALIK